MEGPAHDAVLLVAGRYSEYPIPGFTRHALGRINADGLLFIPMLSREITESKGTRFYAFGYDASGRLNRCSVAGDSQKPIDKSARLHLFCAYGGGAFSYGFAPDPLGSVLYQTVRLLDGKTDSAYKNHCNVKLGRLDAFYADREGARSSA